jgi:hypothetical protein
VVRRADDVGARRVDEVEARRVDEVEARRVDEVEARRVDDRVVDEPDALVVVFGSWPSLRRANWRTKSAVPPTPTSTGHSTKPAAPTAPSVSSAAGVEWLPALTPFRIPAAVPCTPPMTPVTAAPPTAPAAAAVAFAVSVKTRVAFRTIFIAIPACRTPVDNRQEYPWPVRIQTRVRERVFAVRLA